MIELSGADAANGFKIEADNSIGGTIATARNVISGNSTYDNDALGIDLVHSNNPRCHPQR
jgi:parallel beta-helix repeat protein